MTAPFELEPYLECSRRRVEELLRIRAEPAKAEVPGKLRGAMAYSLLDGGKRLRPILCLAFAEAVGRASGAGGVVAEDAAAALEYVHTYSLVHDDLPVMDDDDLRRGRPTNHRVFGEALALLAGDGLLTEAFALVAGDGAWPRGVLCAELAAAAGAAGMVGGQVLDIADERPATEVYLRRMHLMKTGALIRAACRMGVIAGGGSREALEVATIYGEAVGLAFQIMDDVLDVTGNVQAMGKPVGADAAGGRPTFPAVLGLERSREMAEGLVRRAQGALESLEPTAGPLTALAQFCVQRSS